MDIRYWETDSMKVLPNILSFITRGTTLNKMYKTCKVVKFNKLTPSLIEVDETFIQTLKETGS